MLNFRHFVTLLVIYKKFFFLLWAFVERSFLVVAIFQQKISLQLEINNLRVKWRKKKKKSWIFLDTDETTKGTSLLFRVCFQIRWAQLNFEVYFFSWRVEISDFKYLHLIMKLLKINCYEINRFEQKRAFNLIVQSLQSSGLIRH